MQKLLTVTVPCYNSQDYMRRAVESLLPGGERLELLIVDDGSTDATGQIAEQYAARYPDLVRVIHRENGGHGPAVMTGLREARGLYFKVVDSDDWVEEEALKSLLAALKEMDDTGKRADLVITNYIYDHGENGKRKLTHYRRTLPVGKILTWDEIGRFHVGSYFLMHAITFRTELLRNCGLSLPEHTFYVDNIYAYVPMAQVKTLYYLDADLYHYCIGRADQSVNESVMLSRLDQQLRINRIMLSSVDPDQVENPRQREYMLFYLEIIMAATCSFLLRTGKKEDEKQMMDFLCEIRDQYPAAYRYFTAPTVLRHPFGAVMVLPTGITFPIIRIGYRLMRVLFGFN
ncbi:MAG: glycosyltransferase family 2 protein [Oscillospiraceae bacterium]|nr:glycosyltransferase family 2 protein [Oscillospiraceae bacterium]